MSIYVGPILVLDKSPSLVLVNSKFLIRKNYLFNKECMV
jgi:hypothetical protein